MPILLSVVWLFLGIAVSSSEVAAGNGDERITDILIYSRELPDGKMQIVKLSRTTKEAITLLSGTCYRLSPDRNYLAVSSEEAPQSLAVYRFQDDRLIIEVPWNQNWVIPCNFLWRGDSQSLNIYAESTESEQTLYRLDISTGEVTRHVVGLSQVWSPPCSGWGIRGGVDYPSWAENITCQDLIRQLPNFVPANAFFALSDYPNVVLYNRCISGRTYMIIGLNQEQCDGPGEAVLYDIAEARDLTVLEAAPDLTISYRFSAQGDVPGEELMTWSPSGRYLAYTGQVETTLHVYDLNARQYWQPVTISGYEPNWRPEIAWSPDEQKLTFELLIEKGGGPYGTGVVIYNHLTDTTHVLEENSIRASGTWEPSVKWSPDSRAIAFVDADEAVLIYFKIVTNERSVIDDHVDQIIEWVPES